MPSGNRILIPLTQFCGLIRTAYDVGEFQIAGIPEGTGIGATNFFTVEALVENATTPPGIDDIRARLRTVLAERFQLRVRRAPVDMPIYALLTDGGPKAKSCANPKSGTGYVTGLFTAIREQLGLRLESQRAPVDSVIVEHAERPSPN